MAWWLALLWVGVLGVEPSGSKPLGRMAFAENPDEASPLWKQVEGVLDGPSERFWTEEALRERLREADEREGRLERARTLIRQGEDLQLALDLEAAWEEFHRAEAALEEGFVRYHDPELLAQAVLRQGVVRQLQGDLPSARLYFQRALRLAPQLKLSQGYFSPSVRKAFLQASKEMISEPARAPSDEERTRLCAALDLAGLLLLEHDAGRQDAWRLALFQPSSNRTVLQLSLVREESGLLLRPADLAALQAALAQTVPSPGPRKLQGLLEGPKPGSDLAPGPGQAGAPAGPGRPRAWYLRYWWIWPTVAVVVGLSVALPLTVFRTDVVEVELHD